MAPAREQTNAPFATTPTTMRQRDNTGQIQNLPAEILVCVYESLDDIDDVLHLARSCKYLNDVFNPLNTRWKIFSTIIRQAPQHAYDLELCDRVRLYGSFSERFYLKYPIREDSEEGRKQFFADNLDLGKSSRELPAESVWDVVCRWHAMRLLFNLYCNSSVQGSYSTSIYPYTEQIGVWEDREALGREEALLLPSRSYSLDFYALDAGQKQRSYQRFYKALTAHWVAVETLWLARVQVYETTKHCAKAYDIVSSLWTNNPTRPLEEKVDIVEVVDFVWGFLGRKAFHVSSVPNWVDGEGEQMFLSDGDTEASNWLYFIRKVSQFLRPPNIIELLLWMWAPPGHWQIGRPGFLRRLGLFDLPDGIIRYQNQWIRADMYFPLSVVEQDVGFGLRLTKAPKDLEMKWRSYRLKMWPSHARAKVLFRDEPIERSLADTEV